MRMKKFLTSTAVLALLAPALALAAYDDVTISVDVTVAPDNASVTVSGESAVVESITVGASSFSVVMPTNSLIEITSTNRYTLASDDEDVIIEDACSSSLSRLRISNLKQVTKTVTVTISTAAAVKAAGAEEVVGEAAVEVLHPQLRHPLLPQLLRAHPLPPAQSFHLSRSCVRSSRPMSRSAEW